MNRIKKAVSKMIDNKVVERLSNAETLVHENFRKWYKRTTINTIIIGSLIAMGITNYFVTANANILKLLIAIAYLLSIVIFLKRRIDNLRTIFIYGSAIRTCTKIVFLSFTKNTQGQRLKTLAYNIYTWLYGRKLSPLTQKMHSALSFIRCVPDNDEIFKFLYPRLVSFFWKTIFLRLVRYTVFIVLFFLLGYFVKNAVMLEMHFDTIVETVAYPFSYFYRLLK